MTNYIYRCDSLKLLQTLENESVDLIYIDPPFGTGKVQKRTRLKVAKDKNAKRVGFGGNTYTETVLGTSEINYADPVKTFTTFLRDRVIEAKRVLKPNGSIFVHLDHRQVHRAKIFVMDKVFGSKCFQNEIIWAFDFGGRGKNRWAQKSNYILWYSKHPDKYTFNYAAIDRIPYMAPGLAGKAKADVGKCPTNCWWGTIVPTNSKEKTGYPTQKPLWLLDRIVRVHSNPNDVVLDFFSGSGTTGEAAAKLGRTFILCDMNSDAIAISASRLKRFDPIISGL